MASDIKHISLFSGIGGFDYAAEQMGWINVASCEINPFGRKVLEYYWPNAYHHDDIKTLTKEKLDYEIQKRFGLFKESDTIVLTGGFPCQPFSVAGKRKGTEDDRHLWPEMLRVIGWLKPDWIVGENVRGIVNWSDGLVFEQVCSDLENEGYEVQPFIIPACGVNAPHRRERVWFVAYRTSQEREEWEQYRGWEDEKETGTGVEFWAERFCNDGVASDTSIVGRNNGCDNRKERHVQNDIRTSEENKSERKGRINRISKISKTTPNSNSKLPQGWRSKIEPKKAERHLGASFCHNDWQNFPTQSPVCDGNDGISSRLDGITFPKWRNESIKAGGNAIVPQVAMQIFRIIQKMIDDDF